MTKQEILLALGSPSGSDSPGWEGNLCSSHGIKSSYCTELFYGKIKLTFGENKILSYKSYCPKK